MHINNVKVGPHIYKVKYKSPGSLTLDDGITDFSKNEINVNSELVKTQVESTLAHEIMHVLIRTSGACELLGDKEELFVRIIENAFYDFLKGNTKFYDKT